jgi:hypothetical protein
MKLIHHGRCYGSERYSYKEIVFFDSAILETMPQLDSASRAILIVVGYRCA